jgi:exodeoxyribonuclease VII small subunit
MSQSIGEDLTYESALAELECVVRDLEEGKIGLEESIARFEIGVALIKKCYHDLARADQRIRLLTGQDENGQPITQPFEHKSAIDPARSEPKRKRKKPSEDTDQLFDD